MQQVWAQGPLSGAQADLVTLDFGGPTAWRDGCTLNRISLVVSPGGGCMRRRDFIQVIAGSVAAWPMAARGEEAGVPRVGYFQGRYPHARGPVRGPFSKGIGGIGFCARTQLCNRVSLRRRPRRTSADACDRTRAPAGGDAGRNR